jgi:GNAT superfamily N-acetyltransferase
MAPSQHGVIANVAGNRPAAGSTRIRFRHGRPDERSELEALQRRASLKWEEYRADLLANPDAIELPVNQLQENRVRVAEIGSQRVGFSVVIPKAPGVSDLDGLFVEPDRWGQGIGHALIVDSLSLARRQGAQILEVIANPLARGFYEKCGFAEFGTAETRFGPAISMRRPVDA